MSLRTLNDVFFSVVTRNSSCVMMYRRGISWLPISSREFYRDVVGTARALQAWGVGRGDRVSILSENRPEWAVADFACLLIGAVVVPIYSTLTDEQTAYMLQDADARVVFVSTQQQLQKVLNIQARTCVEKVVV